MRTLLLPALLAGCLHERPEAVLGRYLRAESDGRYQVAWGLLAPQDRAARPLEAYAADHTGAGLVWLAVARQTRFEFGKPAPYDARPGDVVVDVVATHPQMRASADAIARALGLPPDLPADEVAERVEDAERVIAALPVPQVAEPIRYVLRPDDRSWLVWIGLSEQDAAISFAAAARRAAAAGDVAAEREALQSLLTVPHDGQGAVEGLQRDARERLAALP